MSGFSVDFEKLAGTRFLLLADTHDDLVDWPGIRGAICEAAGAVDGILHCGDLCTQAALADLSELAPVRAVRSAADPAAQAPVLLDGPRVLRIGELDVGVACSLSTAPVEAETGPPFVFAGLPATEVARALFGAPVDVCVFGGSHVPVTLHAGRTLFVNPGSPSLAARRNLAILEVRGAAACVEQLPLG